MPADLQQGADEYDNDPQNKKKKNRSIIPLLKMMLNHQILKSWKGAREFSMAQAQVVLILLLAWCGNNFPKSYPRNDNHSMPMFYAMNIAFVLAGLWTLHHDAQGSARGVQLLSRPQTEEWKGWMQWAFIMVRSTQLKYYIVVFRRDGHGGIFFSAVCRSIISCICLFHSFSTVSLLQSLFCLQ